LFTKTSAPQLDIVFLSLIIKIIFPLDLELWWDL